ncbi:MAG: hypothetical protein RIC55_33470 [Pirellulaceae bacterium]
MRFPKTALCLLAITAAALAFSSAASTAQAQTAIGVTTYKVQVEYWFFDTDYSYWSTKYESTDYNDAQFVYELLQAADEEGVLNQVAPSTYWRYIAVDVRMISTRTYPTLEDIRYVGPTRYQNLQRLDD